MGSEHFTQVFIRLGEEVMKAASAFNRINGFTKQYFERSAMPDPVEQYYRLTASPSDLVDYIIKQPNHTYKGVTIYPDEAWRYRCKADWIWWRKQHT